MNDGILVCVRDRDGRPKRDILAISAGARAEHGSMRAHRSGFLHGGGLDRGKLLFLFIAATVAAAISGGSATLGSRGGGGGNRGGAGEELDGWRRRSGGGEMGV